MLNAKLWRPLRAQEDLRGRSSRDCQARRVRRLVVLGLGDLGTVMVGVSQGSGFRGV